jgi:hypothetical protein
MAALSAYLADKLIDHSRGVAAYAMPATYVGLVTTASSATGQGTEAAYPGYARVALSGLLGAASAESGSNSSTVSFPACTGGSSTVVGFIITDSATAGAGNLLWFGTCSLSVSSGITPQFAAGALTTSMS